MGLDSAMRPQNMLIPLSFQAGTNPDSLMLFLCVRHSHVVEVTLTTAGLLSALLTVRCHEYKLLNNGCQGCLCWWSLLIVRRGLRDLLVGHMLRDKQDFGEICMRISKPWRTDICNTVSHTANACAGQHHRSMKQLE